MNRSSSFYPTNYKNESGGFIMENLKQIDDLKEGDLTVVTDHGNFHGSYNGEYNCVFFAIPANYKIIGYLQAQEVR